MNMRSMRMKTIAAVLAAVLLVMTAAPALAESFSAIVTSNTMAVYSDSALTRPVDALDKYTVVTVTSYSGKAAKIEYDNTSGYASISNMRSIESIGVKGVTNRSTKVYLAANTRARSATVGEGLQVYVLAVSGNWAFVERNGMLGFMDVTALTKTDDNWNTPEPGATPTPTPKPAQDESVKATVKSEKMTVYAEESTSSKKLGTLKRGREVAVVSHDLEKGWAHIELNGNYGYARVSDLKIAGVTDDEQTPPSNGTEVVVTVSKLPVYSAADVSAKKLGTMKQGQTLNLLRVNGSWAYVTLNGKYGFCAAAGLGKPGEATPTATPSVENAVRGMVSAASLDVYKTASTSSDKVMTLKKGKLVNVLRWNSSWAYIELDGTYGYCAVKGLSKTDVAPDPVPTATPSTENAVEATVIDKTVKVYPIAGESQAAIGTLKQTQVVNVLSVSGDWAYIELAGRYGYCKAASLSLDSKPALDTGYHKGGFSATVIASGARAYASPTTTSNSVALSLGSTVNVYAYNSEWACIVSGGSYAFTQVSKLSRASYSEVSTSGTQVQTLTKTLMSLGYYDGVPGTNYNSATVEAVKRFQAACGLTQTGIADEVTQCILYGGSAPASPLLSAAIGSGSATADVKRLQTRLYALGYLGKSASVDGSYGSVTTYAVAMFQKAMSLSATGMADTSTLKALYSLNAVSLPSGSKKAEDMADSGDDSGSSGGSSSGGVVNPPASVKLSSTYVTTMPAALKSTTSKYSASMSNALKIEHAIYIAQSKLTCPYVYGATGPSKFDCSGLTQYSYKQAGVSLKRTAYSQGYDSGYTKISTVSALKRGDLVFFNTISDSDSCDHVGIYLGGGCFIHASSGGHKVVVSNLASGYYNRVFSWGRRILG